MTNPLDISGRLIAIADTAPIGNEARLDIREAAEALQSQAIEIERLREALLELEPRCHSQTRQHLLAIVHRGLGLAAEEASPEARLYLEYLAEAPDTAFHTWFKARATLEMKP